MELVPRGHPEGIVVASGACLGLTQCANVHFAEVQVPLGVPGWTRGGVWCIVLGAGGGAGTGPWVIWCRSEGREVGGGGCYSRLEPSIIIPQDEDMIMGQLCRLRPLSVFVDERSHHGCLDG